ncbi:ATP-binding protein [Sporosarcina koreensis]|uniref:histidine kinase n=1 Tax=Sporosarcina koreensis TaxID=334735 RepID=A0ABW0U0D0_9BACL
MKHIKLKALKLQTKLTLLIFVLACLVILSFGILFMSILSESVEEEIGKRALSVAETVASMPEVKAAFHSPSPEEIIQPLAEELRRKSGAQFVVVGNKDSIRYSHPSVDQIGQMMVGGDNDLALLHGASYISKSAGTLGPSIRGKAPIIDENDEIIGIVSVGFLNREVEGIVRGYENKIFSLVVLVLCFTIIGSLLIAKNVKKSILGLEPTEIGLLFRERSAILESIHEGIIAINARGHITSINEAAYNILGIEPSKKHLNKPIQTVLPNTKMLEILEDGTSHFNEELKLNNNEIIASRVPILSSGRVIGVVSSFRKKTDIEQLSKELSQVQQYADGLRAQTHEYSNKLYTISGLIQLGSYQDALELIQKETIGYQDFIQFLSESIHDPLLSAILLGKYSRAHELQVDFKIDKESSLEDIPSDFQRDKLVTILGNVLDNSFEAVLAAKHGRKEVHLFMTDLGNEYIFEIEDSGDGVEPDQLPLLFTKGFSTKKGVDRGHGLHLVQRALDSVNGYLTMTESSLGGLSVVIVIPKGEGKS